MRDALTVNPVVCAADGRNWRSPRHDKLIGLALVVGRLGL
jgi:hypothetical protein